MVTRKQTGLSLIGLLLVLACEGVRPANVPQGTAGQSLPKCSTDQECAEGEGCANGLCLPLASEGRVFSVQVTPPSGSGLVTDQLTGVSVGSNGSLDVAITSPIFVRGAVGFAPENGGPADGLETVGGRLLAIAPGLIPGTHFSFETVVRAKQEIGNDWTFEIALLPATTYTFTFVPDIDPARGPLSSLPPHTFTASFVKSGNFDVLLPSRSEYMSASLQGLVIIGEATNQFVRGAKVTAFGDGQRGTSAITDEKGFFRVVVPPKAHGVTIRIEPSKDSPIFPTREFTYADASALSDTVLPKFEVGPIPRMRDVMVIVFSASDQKFQPVPQARLEAEGVAGGGLFSGSSVTGSNGVGYLNLLEGRYALAVIPPEGSPYAATVTTLDLESYPDTSVFSVGVQRRLKLTGNVVREANGEPVPRASVTIQSAKVKAFEGTAQASYEVAASATTDAVGSFELFLDPGIYALSVLPPPDSGLARFSQAEVDLKNDVHVTVRLVKGTLVRGRVISDSGVPVGNAKVELFFDLPRTEDEPSFVGTTFATSLQTAGSGVTDEQGRFNIIVPEAWPQRDKGNGDGWGGHGFGLPRVEMVPSD